MSNQGMGVGWKCPLVSRQPDLSHEAPFALRDLGAPSRSHRRFLLSPPFPDFSRRKAVGRNSDGNWAGDCTGIYDGTIFSAHFGVRFVASMLTFRYFGLAEAMDLFLCFWVAILGNGKSRFQYLMEDRESMALFEERLGGYSLSGGYIRALRCW